MGELEKFKKYLVECEKGVSTQKNYVRNVHDMMEEEGYTLSKEWLSKYRGTDKTTLCEHHCEQSHRRDQPVSEIPGERLEDELCTRPEEQLYRGIQGVPPGGV